MAQTVNFRLVVLVILVIIISSGLGYFDGVTGRTNVLSISTATTSSYVTIILPVTSTERSIATTTLSAISTQLQLVNITLTEPFPSLQLIASITPENISQGQNVSITAAVYNSLPYSVAVEAPPINNPSESSCAITWPTAVTIFPGRFTWSSVLSAEPLTQFNATSVPRCGLPSQTGYKFSPESDQAILQSIPPNNLYPPAISINETIAMTGYFTKAGSETKYTFQDFMPGEYTVVVSDAWGQEVISYFSVS